MGIGLVLSWEGQQESRISSEQYILSTLTQVPEDYQQTAGEHLAAHGGKNQSLNSNFFPLPF